jgi:hypothetical protein
MRPIIWMGALLMLLGILGLAAPVFTTSQTKDVVSLGDLKIQNTEHSRHVVPTSLKRCLIDLGRRTARRRTLPEALTVGPWF